MRAHLFPGQGGQRKGMGKGLFAEFPDLCARADAVLGRSVEELCRDDPGRLLSRTEHAQPAIYVINALHHRAALARGLPPADYLAGHSLGEYNALHAAGAFDFATGLALVRRRAELMGAAGGGGMAAVVGLSEEAIGRVLAAEGAAGVVVANHNAPEQFVLSGPAAELARLKPAFEAREGVRGFVPLRVSGAFHSPAMAAAAESFRAVLAEAEVTDPRTPVVANATGRPYAPGAVRDTLVAQVTRPVLWAESVRHLRAAGVAEFVEMGGGKVLTALVEKTALVAGKTAEDGSDARRQMVERIKREVLHPEIGDAALEFAEDRSFRKLGLDSIVYVRLARRVEAVFGVPFKPDVVYANRTCAALADHLLAHSAPGDSRAAGKSESPVTAESGPGRGRPEGGGPWREHRDERVLALLRDWAEGRDDAGRVAAALRAGGPA